MICIYAVDGNAITYDASGNPTSYYNGYTMTWVEGRKLDTVTVNGQTYTYVYNADGQRVKKINPDGSYIEYYVMDGITVGESHFTATGNKTLGIRYTLDENGTVVGFTMNGVNYYFAKNLQGDVLAVYNATTNELAAQYTYDSWGNILSATGTLEEINPFRYRGYYYDKETDFYYLQSRYYDAAVGRFINEDAFASTGQGILGNNMFTYCLNNPTNYFDNEGTDAIWIQEGDSAASFGHSGLMVQDGGGKWFYFYWGPKDENLSIDLLLSDVDNGSYVQEIDVNGANIRDTKALRSVLSNAGGNAGCRASKITNTYYFIGNYSATCDMVMAMAQSKEKYNLLTNNCVQKTLRAFHASDYRFGMVQNDKLSGIIPNDVELKVAMLPSKKNSFPWRLMFHILLSE